MTIASRDGRISPFPEGEVAVFERFKTDLFLEGFRLRRDPHSAMFRIRKGRPSTVTKAWNIEVIQSARLASVWKDHAVRMIMKMPA